MKTSHNKFTCILISHGGGAPSAIPRASFKPCDNVPGFVSLSLTYYPIIAIRFRYTKQ